jgi:signal transduction histidine kinase/tetratricopeptide (TPR) repeat protein
MRVFAGRFRAIRVLKRGQTIETLLARDLAREADVVVKTAPAATLDAAAHARLEHEAAVLQDLESDFIAPFIAFGREGDLLFLATAFVPGAPLDERLRGGPLAPREVVAVGRTVLAALRDAHARGVLHRDLKPANVIVGERGATLIDFGLARSERLPASIREEPVGTVRYVAPEQAGLFEHGVDARADLYAAGATLYECLTGRPAFEGDTVGEVLRRHLQPRPAPSRSLGFATPRALDEVIERLLPIDPRERYQSAEAALADLDEIARALDEGRDDPAIAIGARDRRRTLAEPAFVGRAEEIAAIDEEMAKASDGAGGLVLLEAPSGGGKSRLLDELARRAASRGARVLRGRGVDQTAARPFEVLEGLAREIVAEARAEPGAGERLRERLGEHGPAACAALPGLAAILGAGGGASLGPEAHAEVRTLRALAALLDALGSADRPALVLLDDAQWADELTLRLLGEWQGGAARHVLVLVSFRSEETESARLRSLRADRRLALRPFRPEETRQLLESMAGELPAEAVAAVVTLSEGNPFAATAVLEGMVEGGALVGEGDGWRVEAAPFAEIRLSRRAAAIAARRLDRLGEATRRLLSIGALLGKEFDLDLAAALAGGAPRDIGAALDEARRGRIVWTDGARSTFVHDKLREALLARLAPEERRRLHEKAAARIEALSRERVFELAYHFDGAGDLARALPYALAAAERARARHALEVAERYYRIAERGGEAGAADRATRLRILEGLADALLMRGRYEEGARRYEAARALGSDPLEEAQIEGKLGKLEMNRGRNHVAIGALERALRLLGRPVPRSALGLALGLGREVVAQLAHTLLPFVFVGRRTLGSAGADRDLLAARFLKHLSLAYFLGGRAFRSLLAHLLMMNLAERYPPTPELGQAYGEHGWILAERARGRRYAERGAAICAAVGDQWGRARTLLSLGYGTCTAGRYREAIETLLEGERLFHRVGDPWEGNWDRVFLAYSHFQAGEIGRAIEMCRRGYVVSVEIGDSFGSATYLHLIARSNPALVPHAWLEAELARPRDHVFETVTLLQLRGEVALAGGEAAEAVAAFEEADRLVRRARVRFDTIVSIPSRLAAALRAEAAGARPDVDARREALLDRAERAARRGVRFARTFRNNLPGALREMALVRAAGERARGTRRLLEESLALARRQGQRLEEAKTLRARGALGLALGWPGAADDARAAGALLREVGADPAPAGEERGAPSFSLAQRFDAVLEAGRKIASAITEESVFAAAREAGLSLLRAETCVVLDPGAAAGAASEEFSRAVLERALETGRAVLEGPGGDLAESTVLAGVRSAICAPILVHGRAAACLYATHRRLGNLFGEREARLAEFVAAIAGAALENAAGFAANRRAEAEIRRLSEAVVRGQEAERRAVALALHDGAGGKLTALGLKLDEAARARDEAARAQRVEAMRSLVDDLLEDVRRLARDLRPATLDRLGLAAALRDLAETTSTDALAVEAVVEPADAPPVPPALAENLYRIAQAALANVARHARAQRARISLARADGALRLEISDDGAGFDPAAAGGGGIGLIGMRERAVWLGGRFAIDAAPGRGTRVLVEVPIRGGGP